MKVVEQATMSKPKHVITTKDCNDDTWYLKVLSEQEAAHEDKPYTWVAKRREATKFMWLSQAFTYAIKNALQPEEYEVTSL